MHRDRCIMQNPAAIAKSAAHAGCRCGSAMMVAPRPLLAALCCWAGGCRQQAAAVCSGLCVLGAGWLLLLPALAHPCIHLACCCAAGCCLAWLPPPCQVAADSLWPSTAAPRPSQASLLPTITFHSAAVALCPHGRGERATGAGT